MKKFCLWLCIVIVITGVVALSACSAPLGTKPSADGTATSPSATENGKENTSAQTQSGKTIDRIEKTASADGVDTYTVFYTDGTTYAFSVANGLDGINGKDGTNGANGQDGVTPTVAIDENGYWVINGVVTTVRAIGKDGANGQDGAPGVNGTNGQDGHSPTIAINEDGYWVIDGVATTAKAIGENGKDGENGHNGQDGVTPTVAIDENGYWVINGVVTTVRAIGKDGANGQDGAPGVNGTNGQDGHSPTIAINEDGYWVIDGVATTAKAIGEDGKDGENGKDGTDGIDGKDGKDGTNGQDGTNGTDGINGTDGVGIESIVTDEDGYVIVTLSDGKIVNLGKWVGAEPETSYLSFYPLDDGTLGVSVGNAVYLSHVTVPNAYQGKTVSTILPNAFAADTALTQIDLPDTIVTIGAKAFANCTALTSIFIPESVQTIAEDAFAGCPATLQRNRIEVAYDTQSFLEAGKQIKLLATAYIRGTATDALTWESLDTSVATVDQAGNVTGVEEGYATVRVKATERPQLSFDFGVTVYDQNTPDLVKTLICANNSTIEWRNLGIGSGTPAYYTDLIESVSKILYNYDYAVNTDYEAVQAGVSDNHGGALDGVEFITVHYTGNMNASAGAVFHAGYFANGTGGTSIHYVVGADGDRIYHILDNGLIAYHAGDGTGASSVLTWLSTGVAYHEDDPVYPEWGISANSKYTINGVETTIAVPTGTTEATKKVTDPHWLNDMGFAYKIVDGEYYMAKTWWCYAQVAEGRLCTKGGNRTSIGIETCVNKGSDIWYTWHLTAKLVAHLMQQYNLPIERVVGHHFYTAKDCPQPMLENDLEMWWKFVDCVKAEYDLLRQGEGYQITMSILDGNELTNDNGRVSALPQEGSRLIRYQLTVEDEHGTEKVVTLAALAHQKDE